VQHLLQKKKMTLTALFAKIKARDPIVFPAWEVLRMATIEGAQAVGLGDEVGSLEPGKQADLILVDLTAPNLSPVIEAPVRNTVLYPVLVGQDKGGQYRASCPIFDNQKDV
jgi:5-methylthioadenosine/S-adenosylhomocysteine deaminase